MGSVALPHLCGLASTHWICQCGLEVISSDILGKLSNSLAPERRPLVDSFTLGTASRHVRIGTLNLNHRALKPKAVPEGLVNALLRLETDLLFLTEYVSTSEYDQALRERWPHMHVTPQLRFNQRGRWSNQVIALSQHPTSVRAAHAPYPSQDAMTNFLSVSMDGLVATGLRAPSYPAATWYEYWRVVGERLNGHVVIGDLNVDPSRRRKRDRVLPSGWRVATPPGPSFRSAATGAESTIDHVLLPVGVELLDATFRSEFFGRWGLDHCPLTVDVRLPMSQLGRT